MANPSSKWDQVPVYGVYLTAPGDLPLAGDVTFSLSQRVNRTDGRVIYPAGAKVKVQIGNPDDQDPAVRAAVRTAWRAADAADPEFDGSAWDIWWDTTILPAAIFTQFPAADDPDVVAPDLKVMVSEALTGASGKTYPIQPLLAHLDLPIPGINLGLMEVPPGSPSVPAPVYAKGIPGGVAALDAEGFVLDGSGARVTGEGGNGQGAVSSVNGMTGAVKLTASDLGAATAADLAGKADKASLGSAASHAVTDFATATQGQRADTAVQPGDLAQVATSGSYTDLKDKPTATTLGAATPADVAEAMSGLGTASTHAATDFATSGQGTKADNAVPNTRMVNDKPLNADVTLTYLDVGAASAAQGALAETALQPGADVGGSAFRIWTGTAWPERADEFTFWISASDPNAPRPPQIHTWEPWLRAPGAVPLT